MKLKQIVSCPIPKLILEFFLVQIKIQDKFKKSVGADGPTEGLFGAAHCKGTSQRGSQGKHVPSSCSLLPVADYPLGTLGMYPGAPVLRVSASGGDWLSLFFHSLFPFTLALASPPPFLCLLPSGTHSS